MRMAPVVLFVGVLGCSVTGPLPPSTPTPATSYPLMSGSATTSTPGGTVPSPASPTSKPLAPSPRPSPSPTPELRASELEFELVPDPLHGVPGDSLEFGVSRRYPGPFLEPSWFISDEFGQSGLLGATRVDTDPPFEAKAYSWTQIKLLKPGPVVAHVKVGQSSGTVLAACQEPELFVERPVSRGYDYPYGAGEPRLFLDQGSLDDHRGPGPGTPRPVLPGEEVDFTKESVLMLDSHSGSGERRPAVCSVSPDRVVVVVPGWRDTAQILDGDGSRYYLLLRIPKVSTNCKIDLVTIDDIERVQN